MSNDESFNDSDELFSLYSSKKITDTFKAQLKKIVASNHHLTKSLPRENTEVISSEKTEDALCAKKFETSPVFNHVNEPSKVNEPCEILEVDISNSTDNYLDESIEIVSEFTPNKCTRQSERLKKKREQPSEYNCSWTSNSNSPVSYKKTRNKKGRRRKKSQKGKIIDTVTLEDSPELTETEDELNPVMSVKVIWKSVNVKKFQIRKFQKLSHIFELLSMEENVPEEKVILTFNNVSVSRNDTPDSLNLQVYHFLDGGVLTELTNSCQSPKSQETETDSNSLMLKFQDVNKQIVKLNLNKHEKIKVGMIKCSEQLEIPLEKIRFFFDGELLNPSETPASLGLENDEVIDIKICEKTA